MEAIVSTAKGDEEKGILIDHPILRFYEKEVSREIKTCPCDDCDPCDYEAR